MPAFLPTPFILSTQQNPLGVHLDPSPQLLLRLFGNLFHSAPNHICIFLTSLLDNFPAVSEKKISLLYFFCPAFIARSYLCIFFPDCERFFHLHDKLIAWHILSYIAWHSWSWHLDPGHTVWNKMESRKSTYLLFNKMRR